MTTEHESEVKMLMKRGITGPTAGQSTDDVLHPSTGARGWHLTGADHTLSPGHITSGERGSDGELGCTNQAAAGDPPDTE